VVELADDRVTTVVDGQAGPSFRQIEVELLEGDERALDAAARLLRAAGARTAEPTPKLARALAGRPVATPPTAPGRRPRLRRKASVEDLVRAAVADGAHRLLAHDPGVRVGDDPEDVHQARVATRRLRSDLRTLGPVLDDFRVPGLRQELQWLGERLGAVRDLDVLAGHLRADAEGLDGAERAGADRLLERLDADRRREALTLRDAMASSRYLALLESLDRLVHQPPLRPDLDAGRRATRTARRLLRRADRRAVRFAQGLGRRPDDPSLHELRKRAKGARYAAELVSPLAPRPVHRLARRMADVQDVLGDLQDTVVADDWLQGLSRRQLSPDEAAAAVALGERQRERQEQARQDWRRAWKRASKRGLRRWFS
jgi:CHAD domain-containing protein